MESVHLTNLMEKRVVNSDGVHIGKVVDLREDGYGDLTELCVRKRRGGEEQLAFVDYPEENGIYFVPMDAFESAKDQLLIK